MQPSEQSFIRLIEQHQKIIHKICNVYVSDTLAKEDLYQEIILQAWKSYASFKGSSKFSTWLYRVALNTAITFFRKEKKQAFIATTEQLPELIHENKTIVEEQASAMYKAIANLNNIDKALVMLYLENYSYDEISSIIGITPNYVAVKMNRIKAQLRETAVDYYQNT